MPLWQWVTPSGGRCVFTTWAQNTVGVLQMGEAWLKATADAVMRGAFWPWCWVWPGNVPARVDYFPDPRGREMAHLWHLSPCGTKKPLWAFSLPAQPSSSSLVPHLDFILLQPLPQGALSTYESLQRSRHRALLQILTLKILMGWKPWRGAEYITLNYASLV